MRLPVRTTAGSMQMEAPEGVAKNLVGNPLGLKRPVLDGRTWTRRSEHVKTFGGADGMNTEHVSVVADDDQAVQPVDAGDDGNAAGRLLSIAAFGFSDDGLLGNAFADQISLAHRTLGELIAAGTAKSDDERGDAAMVELEIGR